MSYYLDKLSLVISITLSLLFLFALSYFFLEIGREENINLEIKLSKESGNLFFREVPLIRQEKNYLASVNGRFYYPIDCRATQRIKEENKIWFSSQLEAKKAGYRETSSCP